MAETYLKYIPAVQWLKTYQREHLLQDVTAATIVTVLLIPQSLAYAMLAGVPPEVGLYASILPLVVYALLGTSRTLSVGPVAIISLMTATTLGNVVAQDMGSYLTAASVLALLSGLFLILMGLLKLGFITNFLSHAVISGFISASGVIIALSQLRYLFGIEAQGGNVKELLPSLVANVGQWHLPTLIVGLCVLLLLFLAKKRAADGLVFLGVNPQFASLLAKTAPILVVFLSIAAAFFLNLESLGVEVTGAIPSGLPTLGFVWPTWELVQALALPAFLISIIGYVESISVGRTLAGKRREKIDPDQELLGLGAANVASSISGGFPVTGGFSRSVVNFDAGAATQGASIITALGIALAALYLAPVLYYLPKATLAATIIVAVFTLVDTSILKKTWKFSRSDFWAVTATILITLVMGVEIGLICGVGLSIALQLYRTSRPHIAEVGLIEGTEQFRNVLRHKVTTLPEILTLRPDESLFFANAAFLEARVHEALHHREKICHVVLQCSAVNEIDYSALEMLESLNQQLAEQNITLHLSEVKGPVMDCLKNTGLLGQLTGRIFNSQFEAFNDLRIAIQQAG